MNKKDEELKKLVEQIVKELYALQDDIATEEFYCFEKETTVVPSYGVYNGIDMLKDKLLEKLEKGVN